MSTSREAVRSDFDRIARALERSGVGDALPPYERALLARLPAACGRVLEVGCGEGRVCRDLAARGHRVTGLDASPTLVRAAVERDPGGEYVVGRPRRCRSRTRPSTR